ncbi:MAG: hypothetical protein RR601_05005 [Erysipelotrichales bacterium]
MRRAINIYEQKLIQNISNKTTIFNLAGIALLAIILYVFKIKIISFTSGLIIITGACFLVRSIVLVMMNLTYMYRKLWHVLLALAIIAYMIYTLIGYQDNRDMFVLVLGGVLLMGSVLIDTISGYILYKGSFKNESL